MPLQATSGAASYDAFGGGVPVAINYIEDVFSTYLYTGTGASLTITNGIDLSTKGGLVWTKCRNAALTGSHRLTDTARGAGNSLVTSNTNGNEADATILSAFTSTGFSLGSSPASNNSGNTFVSWTFREQPKFFDVVTYTGTGSNTTIAHNLGSVPGCIIVKRTSTGGTNWATYHRSLANTEYILLNTTAAKATGATYWNSTTPTSTVFSLGTDAAVNGSGSSYVAYVFAHDAGGFGLTGTDNVVSCGSWTASSTVAVNVTLGYEPQFVLVKNASAVQNWFVWDTMRGMPVDTAQPYLHPNLSNAESSDTYYLSPTATGFTVRANALGSNGNTYIYIAIRRGPMKVPTDATKVFKPVTYTGDSAASRVISGIGFPPDFVNLLYRPGTTITSGFYDRLRGAPILVTGGTNATQSESYWAGTSVNMGAFGQADLTLPTTTGQWNDNTITYVGQFMRRAPSFMDVVCDTGTGSAKTETHNLAVAPELLIRKRRSSPSENWLVLPTVMGLSELRLNQTGAISMGGSSWNNTLPTSSVFSVGSGTDVNGSGYTYVTYLFATCAGVSKVGSYTGTATTKQIDCGFTGGARFVLIKRTDSTGAWYVWDSARGIVSGNDPYLLLNSTAAEDTSTDYIDTYSAGFEISSTAPAAINASGGSYIFLAIA